MFPSDDDVTLMQREFQHILSRACLRRTLHLELVENVTDRQSPEGAKAAHQ